MYSYNYTQLDTRVKPNGGMGIAYLRVRRVKVAEADDRINAPEIRGGWIQYRYIIDAC